VLQTKQTLLLLIGMIIALSVVAPFLGMFQRVPFFSSAAKSVTIVQIGYRNSVPEQISRARALQAGNRYVLLHPDCASVESTYECWQLKCAENEFHKDTIQCTQALIRQQARRGNLIMLNGDIYLPPDFGKSVDKALRVLLRDRVQPKDGYFLVGNRSNYKCDEKSLPVEFAGNQGKFAFDYFVFPKKFFLSFHLPPFILGTWRWDNDLVNNFLKARGIMTVDVSQVV